MVYFRHMAANEITLEELGEMLTHVVDHMATKEDVADIRSEMGDIRSEIGDIRNTMATKDDVRAIVRDELKSVRSELKEIRDEFDDLSEKVENVSGFRKEIDHALERIAAIERQLGITKKTAA
jgi:chromosome segregation ATPase